MTTLKDADIKILEMYQSLKVKCKCGHTQVMPVFIDTANCKHCGRKLHNNTHEYFKYKLRKELNK